MIVEKFDTIKDEITNSSKKMEGYKDTVEQNSLEIKVLEAENVNLEMKANQKQALVNEIETEGGKIKKQVDTLTNLKKALLVQLENA